MSLLSIPAHGFLPQFDPRTNTLSVRWAELTSPARLMRRGGYFITTPGPWQMLSGSHELAFFCNKDRIGQTIVNRVLLEGEVSPEELANRLNQATMCARVLDDGRVVIAARKGYRAVVARTQDTSAALLLGLPIQATQSPQLVAVTPPAPSTVVHDPVGADIFALGALFQYALVQPTEPNSWTSATPWMAPVGPGEWCVLEALGSPGQRLSARWLGPSTDTSIVLQSFPTVSSDGDAGGAILLPVRTRQTYWTQVHWPIPERELEGYNGITVCVNDEAYVDLTAMPDWQTARFNGAYDQQE